RKRKTIIHIFICWFRFGPGYGKQFGLNIVCITRRFFVRLICAAVRCIDQVWKELCIGTE
ncbi:MAG: hypothetical protein MUO68_08515, partial [Desulfobacteraceae bacterium]|nr:hypothetical protein [Desulfobacteraceae bacterium]